MRDATDLAKEQNIIGMYIPKHYPLVLLKKVAWKQGKASRS